MSNYAFVNAKVFNSENGEFSPLSTVVVQDGIISSVGPNDQTVLPAGTRSIDLQGKYLMPGLINAHVHLTLSGKPSKATKAGKSQQRLLKILETGMGKSVLRKMMAQNLSDQLNSGVTTSRSLGDLFYADVEVRDMITSGKIPGPRLYVAGPIITTTHGHGQALGTIADSPWGLRKEVRSHIHNRVDIIKICSTGGVTDARTIGDAGRVTMTLDEITAVCEEAHTAGLPVACHAEGSEGVKLALKGGVDTIEHGSDLDDEMIELFLNNPKTLKGYSGLIPTLYPALVIAKLDSSVTHMNHMNIANSEIVYEEMVNCLKQATEAGIRVGFGTDAAMPFVTHYNSWRELEFVMKAAGVSPSQALMNATRVSADILGIDEQTGSIAKGKCADLMVVDENPLENIRTLSKPVMVARGSNLIEKPKFKANPVVDRIMDTL